MSDSKNDWELRKALLQQEREEGFKIGYEEGLKIGREEGRVQKQRQFIENFILARFGAIDETLASSIEPLLKWSIAPLARLMLELSSLERDEFLARCLSTQNRNGTH